MLSICPWAHFDPQMWAKAETIWPSQAREMLNSRPGGVQDAIPSGNASIRECTIQKFWCFISCFSSLRRIFHHFLILFCQFSFWVFKKCRFVWEEKNVFKPSLPFLLLSEKTHCFLLFVPIFPAILFSCRTFEKWSFSVFSSSIFAKISCFLRFSHSDRLARGQPKTDEG